MLLNTKSQWELSHLPPFFQVSQWEYDSCCHPSLILFWSTCFLLWYFDYLQQPISLVVSLLISKVFTLLGSHMHGCCRLRAAHHSVLPFILDKTENLSTPNGTFPISLCFPWQFRTMSTCKEIPGMLRSLSREELGRKYQSSCFNRLPSRQWWEFSPLSII